MENECRFCRFVQDDDPHRNGYPFIPVQERDKTVSFLSIDFPAESDGHTLVIPKQHYERIEDIPEATLHELIDHVQAVSEVIGHLHDGCNILLNNGEAADQFVPHAHFHIIPRDHDDNVVIEDFERKDMTEERFRELTSEIQDRLDK